MPRTSGAAVGTGENPTVAGMLFKAGDEVRGLWAGHADHPLRYIPGVNLGSEMTVVHTPMAVR